MATPSSLTGAPCWIDIVTSDFDAFSSFYGALFGWEFTDSGPDNGNYHTIEAATGRIGGVMPLALIPEEYRVVGMEDWWGVYLRASDGDATIERAVASGAEVIVDLMAMPEIGRSGTIKAPDGAYVAIWEPGGVNGFDVISDPGTPAWFELHTRAYDQAVAFYRDVFGWDTTVQGDEPEFRYTTLGAGDDMAAGIMDASGWYPEGTPGQWSVYFATDDVDQTVAAATDAGASVVDGPDDTPYGRLATVADPLGTTFKLRQTD